MSEETQIRPIGTEFEEVSETSTERIITRLKVARHQRGGDGQMYEFIEEVSETVVKKTPPGGSERKADGN